MTIDNAILRIEHSSMNVDDKETADFIIDTMRKYQKIEEIIKDHDADNMPEDYWYIDEIREVIEDGNENSYNAPNT